MLGGLCGGSGTISDRRHQPITDAQRVDLLWSLHSTPSPDQRLREGAENVNIMSVSLNHAVVFIGLVSRHHH